MTAAGLLAAISLGCGGGGGGADGADAPGAGDGAAGSDSATECPRLPGAADRPRKVVVSHPYGEGGSPASRWEVLELDLQGGLTAGGTSFEMGRATSGRVAFTPDGEIGLVAQEDGTLGAFRFDEAGAPQVIHAAFAGGFYAGSVTMDPGGARAWVLDGNWRENGGGIYAVAIGCDGTLVDEGRVAPARLPAAMIFTSGGVLVAAADVGDSRVGDEAHLLTWGPSATILDGEDAFSDDEAILSDAALAGGRWLAIGDNSAFSSLPNRVALIERQGATLARRQIVEVMDPYSIVGAPDDDLFLVASGFGDALFRLAPAGGSWVASEIVYAGAAPQLPGSAVLIERGALAGHVLVAENVAVRRLRFGPEPGAVTDLGPFPLGDGYTAITGAIGVQP